jgi:TM2 domain-containing membrane protein YozV
VSTPSSPGWHDDPDGRRRWWDGQRWGAYAPWDEASAAAPRPQPPAPAPLQLDRRLLHDPTPSASARSEGAPAQQRPTKSLAVALWLAVLLGPFGAHRFYLGRTGSAFALLSISLVGCMLIVVGVPLLIATAAWWLLDIVRTRSMVSAENARAALAPRPGVYRGWPTA